MNSEDSSDSVMGGILGILLVFGPLISIVSLFLLWPIYKIIVWFNPGCEFFPSITRCIGGDPDFNADWMTLTSIVLAIAAGVMWGLKKRKSNSGGNFYFPNGA